MIFKKTALAVIVAASIASSNANAFFGDLGKGLGDAVGGIADSVGGAVSSVTGSDEPGKDEGIVGWICRSQFGDEYELSIITGKGAYSTESAPYEIAVFKHGDITEMPGITDENDCIKGYLTEADVGAIIKKMFLITGKSPVQV